MLKHRFKKSMKKQVGGASQSRQGAFGISNAGDQIVKRISFPGNSLGTGAGTTIPVAAFGTASVTSCTEWASFAARYQQYRVRAIRITGKATQPVQLAAVSHSALFRGDFIGSSAPSTSAQVLSDENVKIVATCKDFVDIVSWVRNPNAKLWNPTSGAPPAANQFSWVGASASAPLLTTATTYYCLIAEYEVEFRGSQ